MSGFDHIFGKFEECNVKQVLTTREDHERILVEAKEKARIKNEAGGKVNYFNYIKWDVIAACDCTIKISHYDLKKNKDFNCSKCNFKEMGKNKTVPFEDYKELFCSYGIIMLSEEEDYYRGGEDGKKGMVRYPAHILARCDHERRTTFENFVKTEEGFGVCENCRGKKKYHIYLPYSDMVELLEKHGCKMFTTEEDFLYNELNIFRPIEIIGSCGHKSEELFNDIPFEQGKQTPCQVCREAKAAATRERLVNPDTNRLRVLEVEEEASNWIKSLLNEKFEVLITNEGCKADMAIKPLESDEDEWAMIQLKSASKTKEGSGDSFAYSLKKNDYSDMIVVFTAKVANSIWIIDGEMIKDLTGVNLSLNRGTKYIDYKVHPDYFLHEVTQLWDSSKIKKMPIKDIMKRHFKSVQNEDIYMHLRKSNIDFIKFEEVRNYESTDFLVNGFKVQEKFAYKDHQQYNLNLHKNGGIKDKKVPYEKGDNDFYWIHLGEWRLFYVIPEKILIENGYIVEDGKKAKPHIGIYPKLYNETPKDNEWIEEFVFDYHNIDVQKLKSLFNL